MGYYLEQEDLDKWAQSLNSDAVRRIYDILNAERERGALDVHSPEAYLLSELYYKFWEHGAHVHSMKQQL